MFSLYGVILAAVFGTSVLSGIFGMAGGLILMGIYATLLPVATAMILHGFTQAGANGFRWYLLRRHTDWAGIRYYAAGAAASAALLSLVSFIPDKALVFLFLGGLPLVSAVLPPMRPLNFSRRSGALLCGALVTGIQLVAGVAGPLLDLFFVNSALRKEQVVATKSFTQTLSHLLKLIYFAHLAGAAAPSLEVSSWLFPAILGTSFLGTFAGSRVLDRLSEQRFRRYSHALITGIGLIYLARGIGALWL